MLIDTHCHLDFPEFNQDRDAVIKRAKEQGIDYIVNIGSSLSGSEKSWELSQKYDFIYTAVGLHPHEADTFNQDTRATLRDLAGRDKVVAIGEVGLDYYKNYSQPENQKQLFTSLVALAKEMELPLVIHSRQAQDDTLKILKEYMPIKAILHCFSGDAGFLEECLKLGFLVSFTCNITYKKAQDIRFLVKITPLERLLLETDAPFLPPEGFRGMRNEPMHIKLLAERIAELKAKDLEEIARVTTRNAKIFFNLG